MLATTCSKPEAMKASTAQKRTTAFPASERRRPQAQIAAHTRTLHRTPRARSWPPVSCAFAASIDATMPPAAALVRSTPACTTSHANAMEPARLPTRHSAREPTAARTRTARVTTPWARTSIADVASSAPAKTMSVSAAANTLPATRRSAGEPAARNGPAVPTMSTTPTPI